MDSESKDTVQKKKTTIQSWGCRTRWPRRSERRERRHKRKDEGRVTDEQEQEGGGWEEGRAREGRREGRLSETVLAVRGSHIQRPTCFPVTPWQPRSQPAAELCMTRSRHEMSTSKPNEWEIYIYHPAVVKVQHGGGHRSGETHKAERWHFHRPP